MTIHLVNIPIESSPDQVAFGSVGTVVYRDTVNGVRYTAHADGHGNYWVCRHEAPRGDSDGPAVARSGLFNDHGSLVGFWAALRGK
jgi:hypothetical protein